MERHPFDLDATLNSGQVFHWHQHENGWLGGIGDSPVWLTQQDGRLEIKPSGMIQRASDYLGVNHPMDQIVASFPKEDQPLREAMAFCRGLRILRQPVWECLATFITSSLKQVPHIRKISLTLRQKFGSPLPPVCAAGPVLHGYPSPEALAVVGEAALRECGLGYRAAFLHRTAVAVAEGREQLSVLEHLPTAEARARLMQFHGVGEKIANCVLLFGCGKYDAFPIDVWIERVLRQLYFPRHRNVSEQRIRKFASEHFGPNAGYAQQFLFHHARLTKLKADKK